MIQKHVKLPNGIEVEGWRITANKGAIYNTTEKDRLGEQLGLGSVPEMVFGQNDLSLLHIATGTTLSFCGVDALKLVARQAPAGIKVAAAHTWSKSNRTQVDAITQSPGSEKASNYDWTFTTHYKGSLKDGGENHSIQIEPSSVPIPLDKLKQPDPILFYDEVHLFEDELSDNGISELCIKIRVMPRYFFCLLRLWIRVDDVLFRIIDTRVYHEFGTNEIIREWSSKEAPWEKVEPNIRNLKQLTDSNFISTLLSAKAPPELEVIRFT